MAIAARWGAAPAPDGGEAGEAAAEVCSQMSETRSAMSETYEETKRASAASARAVGLERMVETRGWMERTRREVVSSR